MAFSTTASGRDWDATITKIVDQPISIRQAFWAAHKKSFVSSKSRSRSAAAAARCRFDRKLATAALSTEKAAVTGQGPGSKAELDSGAIAASGVRRCGHQRHDQRRVVGASSRSRPVDAVGRGGRSVADLRTVHTVLAWPSCASAI